MNSLENVTKIVGTDDLGHVLGQKRDLAGRKGYFGTAARVIWAWAQLRPATERAASQT
jgi:hypothetical protein